MLIRSQGKTRLGNYKEFIVMGMGVHGVNSACGDSSFLGKYETEKRAIEVLDEIEEQLQNTSIEDEIIGGVRVQREIVFQMPER